MTFYGQPNLLKSARVNGFIPPGQSCGPFAFLNSSPKYQWKERKPSERATKGGWCQPGWIDSNRDRNRTASCDVRASRRAFSNAVIKKLCAILASLRLHIETKGDALQRSTRLRSHHSFVQQRCAINLLCLCVSCNAQFFFALPGPQSILFLGWKNFVPSISTSPPCKNSSILRRRLVGDV